MGLDDPMILVLVMFVICLLAVILGTWLYGNVVLPAEG